jgi:hypothetical protein
MPNNKTVIFTPAFKDQSQIVNNFCWLPLEKVCQPLIADDYQQNKSHFGIVVMQATNYPPGSIKIVDITKEDLAARKKIFLDKDIEGILEALLEIEELEDGHTSILKGRVWILALEEFVGTSPGLAHPAHVDPF